MATHVSKQSHVAFAALLELRGACEMFENAAKQGGRAVKFLVSCSIYLFISHVLRYAFEWVPHSKYLISNFGFISFFEFY